MSEPSHADIWIWIDDAPRPAAEARVPVLDRGFLYGDSVFEVTRTVDGQPMLWEQHLERLERSAAAIGYAVPARPVISQAVQSTLACVPAADKYVRIIVTRGAGPLDLDPAAADAPRLIVIAKPLRLPEPRLYREGASLVTVGERRNAPGHVPAEVKSSNYLSSVLALQAARKRGAYEALMCDLDGHICEGASSNFFIVSDGRLITPPLSVGILAGVTRAAVLELGAAAGLPTIEALFGIEEALAADEAFVSSSIRGLLPVTQLDGQPIGNGQPGPITRRLMNRYVETYLERNSSASPIRNISSKSPI